MQNHGGKEAAATVVSLLCDMVRKAVILFWGNDSAKLFSRLLAKVMIDPYSSQGMEVLPGIISKPGMANKEQASVFMQMKDEQRSSSGWCSVQLSIACSGEGELFPALSEGGTTVLSFYQPTVKVDLIK